MVEKKRGYGAEILVVIITIAAVAGVYVAAAPGSPSVNVQILPKGGVLQNITISCYECVAEGPNVWKGTLSLGGVKTVDVSSPTGASLGLTLEYGLGAPLSSVPDCTGLRTNSTCVVYTTHSLPFSVGLDIDKTSNGGNLKVIVYYGNGMGIVFNATSGHISQSVNFEEE